MPENQVLLTIGTASGARVGGLHGRKAACCTATGQIARERKPRFGQA